MIKFLENIDKAITFKGLLAFVLAILILFSVVITCPTAYAADTNNQADDEPPIIVSMGDSYSSGEGIEPFYGQSLSNKDKVKNDDWLAHRSEKSWAGMLDIPGLDNATRKYKGTNWFFVASSGAETKHLKYEQPKEYSIGVLGQHDGTEYLEPQLDIFKNLKPNSVDYVTLTLGGNDVGFADIVKETVVGSTYLNTSKLSDMINDVWAKFFETDGIREDLYDSYKDIAKAAGAQAQIIVAGYPCLLDPNGGGAPFSKEEATIVNNAVRNFNDQIEQIVNLCASQGIKICFVSVEDEFKGHEVGSRHPYINGVYIGSMPEELKNFVVASAYSVHPNYDGAVAYAKCVNKKIEQLVEDEKAREEQEALNPTPKDREIVLVLDRSASMGGTPILETKTAARQFVSNVLEAEANIGIVTYANDAQICSALTDSQKYLNTAIDTIYTYGGTNIEAGLKMADDILEDRDAKKKIIVLMSDGEPNNGKSGQGLIDYAGELKNKGYYIYTLGFFSELSNKTSAMSLMEGIASEGCHFEVTDAESLRFFFGDIAEQINGTKYYYIRIACPVDVTVSYNGEKMSSKGNYSSVRTSFGTMTFEESTGNNNSASNNGSGMSNDLDVWDNGSSNQNNGDAWKTPDSSKSNDTRVKILRLKEGADYEIEIDGNGTGTMKYTIGFMDENGEYSDIRTFSNVKITKATKIDTLAAAGDKTYMYVDEDGDGDYDITYRAMADSRAEKIDNSIYVYVGIAGVAALIVVAFVVIMIRRSKIKKYL